MLFLGEYLGLIFCVTLLGQLICNSFFGAILTLFCLIQIRSVLPRMKFFGVYSLGFGFFGLLAFVVLVLPTIQVGIGLMLVIVGPLFLSFCFLGNLLKYSSLFTREALLRSESPVAWFGFPCSLSFRECYAARCPCLGKVPGSWAYSSPRFTLKNRFLK